MFLQNISRKSTSESIALFPPTAMRLPQCIGGAEQEKLRFVDIRSRSLFSRKVSVTLTSHIGIFFEYI
jgi:hypothetical protein